MVRGDAARIAGVSGARSDGGLAAVHSSWIASYRSGHALTRRPYAQRLSRMEIVCQKTNSAGSPLQVTYRHFRRGRTARPSLGAAESTTCPAASPCQRSDPLVLSFRRCHLDSKARAAEPDHSVRAAAYCEQPPGAARAASRDLSRQNAIRTMGKRLRQVFSYSPTSTQKANARLDAQFG